MANDRDELMRLAAEYDGLAGAADMSGKTAERNAWRRAASDLRTLAQRAPQNGAVPKGMLDLVEALDAAMVESLMGEGADIWKGNRGKLRNRLPENVGAILAKMRALLAAAPAPEAPPLIYQARDAENHGTWYDLRREQFDALEQTDAVTRIVRAAADTQPPEAERAKGEAASGVIVDRDARGLIDKVYVVKGGRKELLATNPEHVIDVRIVPPPAGQPDGVGALESLAIQADAASKSHDERHMAITLASIAEGLLRLASAQRAEGDNTK